MSFEVKSQLAKLLATENLTLEHRAGIKTAYIDMKNRVIALPIWKNISDDLYDMMVVHEVGHALDTPSDGWFDSIKKIAAKHYKNPTDKHRAAVQRFINVVEDVRIDRRQKIRYPGSKRNYVNGYVDLYKQDAFRVDKMDLNKLPFIDRINVYFKGGHSFMIKFTDEELATLKKIETLDSFDDVVDMADYLFGLDKQQHEEEQKQKQDEKNGKGKGKSKDKSKDKSKGKGKDKDKADKGEAGDDEQDEEGSGQDDDSDDSEDQGDDKGQGSDSDDDSDEDGDQGDGEGDDSDDDDDAGDQDKSKGKGKLKSDDADDEDSDGDEDGDSDGDGDESGDEDNDLSQGQPNRGELGGEGHDDYIPTSFTEEALSQTIESLVDNNAGEYVYLNLPKVNLHSILDDYKTVMSELIPLLEKEGKLLADKEPMKEFEEWKKAENETISFMVKEFEMRKAADQYARAAEAKTGVLNMNKVHSYKFNEDLFKKMTVVGNGKNHGFVMLLDWSGSMTSNINQVVRQMLSLTMFCKRVNIPFEVFLFRDYRWGENALESFIYQDGDLNMRNFKLRNLLSSKMKPAEYQQAMKMVWQMSKDRGGPLDPMNGTPLNQAIYVLDEVVNNFQKTNNVQIVSTIIMTDGSSDALTGWSPTELERKKSLSMSRHASRNRYVLRDQKTKKTYTQVSNPKGWGDQATKMMLQILKDRTNSHLLGFFLCNNGYRHVAATDIENDKAEKDFDNNGFAAVKSAGYDEYYLINQSKMTIQKGGAFSGWYKGMKDEDVSKAFVDHGLVKKRNRYLLTGFITRIAQEVKARKLEK